MEDCADCGVLFWVTEQYQRRKKKDHTSFYCPTGHSVNYPGKSDLDKCQEKLGDARKQIDNQHVEIRLLEKNLKKKNKQGVDKK